jgi:ABC-type branched-subunit amino acid transport system substrate-binding protein
VGLTDRSRRPAAEFGLRAASGILTATAVAAILLVPTTGGAESTAGGTGKGTPPHVPTCAPVAAATRAGRDAAPGVTPNTVTVGNVSTDSGPIPGLFAGAAVGVRAYFASVNARGGVDGRRLEVSPSDDGLNGQQDESETASSIASDLALVGSFSVDDGYGCTVLAQNPTVPDVSVSLDPGTDALPNLFSVDPTANGWELGPLAYFKAHFPKAVRTVGALVANQPTAISHWDGLDAAMTHEGYHVVSVQYTTPLATDFTTQVLKMRQAGVEMVDLTAEPVSDSALFIRDMDEQGWHPMLVTSGGPIYDSQFVSEAGGASAVDSAATDGVWLDATQSLYLGQDARVIPAVATLDHWVQVVDPGFSTDLYTLFGWASAQLFTEALQAAGPHPTRGAVLASLSKIRSFTASGLLAPDDPAAKVPPSCYILAKVENGQFARVADPPHGGFRCDAPFYYAPGAPSGAQ